MILIGQYDSPYTRRIGITLTTYGMTFTHNTWSVFGNADELSQVNPLIRVPTLVLENGEALIETAAIIDYLDSLVPPAERLMPQENPLRYRCQKIIGMASGISDMAVRLFYEQRLHDVPSQAFVARITKQLQGALTWLEEDRASRKTDTWFGGPMTQADIAVTCALRHLSESQPVAGNLEGYPALAKHCHTFEAMDVFKAISQAFIAPA